MFVLLSTILLGSFFNTNVFAKSFARITLKVADESGKAIPHARVGISFLIFTKGGKDSETKEDAGYTNSEGLFSASALADNHVGFNVIKDGYYVSLGSYKFKESSLGRWQPWNPEITIVLRKKENPVPMYARDTSESILRMPQINKNVGFDLAEFDWVAPYGKGKHADFIFKLEGTFVNEDIYDMTLTISFSEKHDGIQTIEEDRYTGSVFNLPRFAYETGYVNKLIKFRKEAKKKLIEDNFKERNNYMFRVRSEERDGKLLRAMYGKILGDIKFYPKSSSTAVIIMKYYLNPDYTRNLEYGGNLFKNLPSLEKVGIQ